MFTVILPDLRGFARGLHMAAGFSLFGTCGMAAFLLPPGWLPGIKRLAWGSFLLLVVAGIIWFVAGSADMADAGDWSDVRAAIRLVAGSTRFGALLIGRIAAASLAICCFHFGLKRLATFVAGMAVVAEAWLDHGGAMTGITGNALLACAIIHLASGGIWLGALPALRLALRDLPLPAAARLAARFSPIGIACVFGMVVSAIAQYMFLVGSPSALFNNAYGLTVVVKILLLAMLLSLAAANRYRFTPLLAAGREAARAQLLRSVGLEIILALLALLAAGWLLQLTPPTMALMLNKR